MIELSPSQERKLHSILDKGLNTLNENSEKTASSSPFLQKILNKPKETQLHSSEKTQVFNSELKSLQEKLANLEARLVSNNDGKPVKIQIKSPQGNFKVTSDSTPRSSSNLPRRSFKREKGKKIEEFDKNERSITPSCTRFKGKEKKNAGTRPSSTRAKDFERKLKRENEALKGDMRKIEIVLDDYEKMKEDYQNLVSAFEKSEKIRKKQKELIRKLQGELKSTYK